MNIEVAVRLRPLLDKLARIQKLTSQTISSATVQMTTYPFLTKGDCIKMDHLEQLHCTKRPSFEEVLLW